MFWECDLNNKMAVLVQTEHSIVSSHVLLVGIMYKVIDVTSQGNEQMICHVICHALMIQIWMIWNKPLHESIHTKLEYTKMIIYNQKQ